MIDHRRLGRELELFHTDPLVGAGLPIWLPAGAAGRAAVEGYLRELERRHGYQHVYSPPLAKREMYQRSGHLAKFAADMFPAMADGEDELMLRPSLCPHHAAVFNARGRSYRELPLRIAEIGNMFRAERSGVLSGLSRVRCIALNDGHTFCALDQVGDEVARELALMGQAHQALGFAASSYRLSLRGPAILGEPEAWDLAEDLLRQALRSVGVSFVEAPGEAAFYGPKIDVQIIDALGREETLATVQLDFYQPAQFDLSYVDSGGARVRPVMVHRSLVGSMERLFAHLIEVHQGVFPAWYAPVQVLVLPVGPDQEEAAQSFVDQCIQAGLRAEVLPDGSLSARVREAAVRHVPHIAIIGAREAGAGTVTLRPANATHPLPDALALLSSACAPPL
jgi:threonyl-tRNA synthetase